MREFLFTALIVAFVAILALSPNPWFGGTHLVVSKIGEVTVPTAEVGDATYAIASDGIHIPTPTSKVQDFLILALFNGRSELRFPTRLSSPTRPALGYMVSEITLLGMPFGYYTEGGYALFTRSDWGVTALPLGEEGIAMLNRANHRDVREGTLYPYWRHFWGWLFVAGVALWGWLQAQHFARKREAAGMI